MEKKKLAIVGCGKLGEIVANAYINGLLNEYKLVGVYSRTTESAESLVEKVNQAMNKDDCLGLLRANILRLASVRTR